MEQEEAVYPRRLHIFSQKISYARNYFLGESSEELSDDDLVIGTAPNLDSFNRWAEEHREIKCDFVNGKIIIREWTTTGHASCEGALMMQFCLQGFEPMPSLSMTSDTTQTTILQPDIALRVDAISTRAGGTKPGGNAYIALVVEVDCKQRVRNIHERASIFCGADYPSVEFYVGLKRYEPRVDGTQGMVAAVYTRANNGVIPIQVVSFGTGALDPSTWWHLQTTTPGWPAFTGVGYGGPPNNAPGTVPYTLVFPAATFYSTRPGGLPAGAPAAYMIDLHPIQNRFTAQVAY